MLQIGDVARQVGLSLRTVRFYEEAGLLTPVGRTQGGFRLYDEDALDRLLLIKRMKPLGFTLEEMRSLLGVRDELRLPDLAPDRRHELQERLRTWAVLAEGKLADLRARAGIAADFVAGLHDDAAREPDPPAGTADTTPGDGASAVTSDDVSQDDVSQDGETRAGPPTETTSDTI
ncbi:MerR family transcriptional regulator [Frankia nepalensis]|uniref:MerR family transcriptional regulator n=1 Tax=Frankia nepalensis TaxID=1836974 RepID=UPI0027DB09DA|nr:MerR family transcriptional regulator [Frankia nepalensis]